MPDRDHPRRTGFDACDRALVGLGDAAAWLFFATFVISVAEVASRYLFNAPTSWAHVTSTALCVAAFALGGSHAMALDRHLRVTVVSDRLHGRYRDAAQVLALACGAVYLAGLSWGLWREAAQALWRFDYRGAWVPELTPGPPNWPLPAFGKVMLLIGALLFLFALLNAALRLASRASRPV